MKCDMAGAATITQATLAIAGLGLPVQVTAYACLAENMVSGTSMRPGDVLTIYGGKTVEVLNTDAEGRLVLADGLGRAVEQEPDVIIDVATLTGHMVDGARRPGRRGVRQRRRSSASLVEAGHASPARSTGRCRSRRTSSSGCTAARSPTSPSTTGRAGAAGCSRRRSCASSPASCPWAHLDIAGPGFNNGAAAGHWPPGGTGFALTTLVDYARPGRSTRTPRSLLPLDVLAHPLRDADHAGLVRRDAAPLAERVGPVGRRHPATGELAVPGHQQQRHVADRGARLDEALDALAGRDEVLEVLLVVARRTPAPASTRCARCRRRGGGTAVRDRVRRVS